MRKFGRVEVGWDKDFLRNEEEWGGGGSGEGRGGGGTRREPYRSWNRTIVCLYVRTFACVCLVCPCANVFMSFSFDHDITPTACMSAAIEPGDLIFRPTLFYGAIKTEALSLFAVCILEKPDVKATSMFWSRLCFLGREEAVLPNGLFWHAGFSTQIWRLPKIEKFVFYPPTKSS